MAVLLTGVTGYLGSYIAAELLATTDERLALIIRADSVAAAKQRLWRALQLHMDFARFRHYCTRIDIYPGDITQSYCGLSLSARKRLTASIDSVIHAAAALNRKSLHVCVNTNLLGTLEVIRLAHAARQHGGLRRFSLVSTVAVAVSQRRHQTIYEDDCWQWQQRIEDPYIFSKRLAEQLLQRLLPAADCLVFRPSAVIGDSRFGDTTQFDAARALVLLAKTGIVPWPQDWRIDIVPADYVGRSIVALHQKSTPQHPVYHLSAGSAALSYANIVASLRDAGICRKVIFAAMLEKPFLTLNTALAALPWPSRLSHAARLLKAFMPFMLADNVFDNSRISRELNDRPEPFKNYAGAFYRFVVDHQFRYPYQPWPDNLTA